jgi:hypothetical protein
VARRQPRIRWRVWRTSRSGTAPQGGDHGPAAAHAVPVHDVLTCGAGGELVQSGCQQSAPLLGHIDLGVSGGAGELCPATTALSREDTSRLFRMKP